MLPEPSSGERGLAALTFATITLALLSLGGVLPAWMPSTGVLAALTVVLYAARLLFRRWRTGILPRPMAFVGGRRFEVALAAVAFLGLVVRLLGISHGPGHLPTDIDENRLASSVLFFLRTGTIDHETVEHYPGIHFWILCAGFFVTYFRGLLNETMGVFTSVPPHPFVVVGRETNAVLETATIVLTGLLGRLVAGAPAGVLGALLLAFSPLAIVVSSQLRNDAALALCAVGATYAAVLAASSKSRWPVVLAGISAGLGAAIKYSGVFALLPVLISCAVVAVSARERLNRLGLALVGFVVALGITNHFLWADVPNLIRQLSDQIAITGAGHWAASSNPRFFYTATLGESGVGWPVLVSATLFAAYGLAAGNRTVILLVAFPLSYIWFMSGRPSQLPRWVHPAEPFVAIAGVAGLLSVREFLATRFATSGRPRTIGTALGASVVALALLPLAVVSAREISRRPTAPPYQLAEEWLRAEGQPGDRVMAEVEWLDLTGAPVTVTRVEDLNRSLDAGDLELNTYTWIVVPETSLAAPNIKRLVLVRTFTADHHFGGNAGVDVRIYEPPQLGPFDVSSVAADSTAAAPFVGLGLEGDASGRPGLVISPEGGRLYLPAPDRPGRHLEIDVLATRAAGATAELPVRLTVQDTAVPLQILSGDGDRWRLISAELPSSSARTKAITVVVSPLKPGVRLTRFGLRAPS